MNLDNLEIKSGNAVAKKLYTGIAPIQIVAVNPTRAELANLFETEEEKIKEPNYFTEDSTRIDFWYRNHSNLNTPLFGKFALFVSQTPRISQTGKTQFIDNFSKSCWAENLGDLANRNAGLADFKKLNLKDVRTAIKGEEDLYNLLRAYGNVDINNSPFMLDDITAIVKGNVKELREFFAHFNQRGGGIKVLMGVKDGQYQDVWNNLFLTLNGKISDYILNRITEPNYGYKQYYGGSLSFQEFVADAEPASIENEKDPWDSDPFEDTPKASSTTAPTNTSDDDDLFG